MSSSIQPHPKILIVWLFLFVLPVAAIETSVLQVGAGPSGLVMALALRRNGVPVRLIDKETTSRLGQRGAGIMVRLPWRFDSVLGLNIKCHQPRSMELFSALGVGDEIMRRAIPAPQAIMYQMPGGVKQLAKFDMWPPAEPTPQRPFVRASL